MTGSFKNFPVRCFYNKNEKLFISFYKHGQRFIINSDDINSFDVDGEGIDDIGQVT